MANLDWGGGCLAAFQEDQLLSGDLKDKEVAKYWGGGGGRSMFQAEEQVHTWEGRK